MDDYKRAYGLLVSEVDRALELMDTDDLPELHSVRDILIEALQDAEAIFAGDENCGNG